MTSKASALKERERLRGERVKAREVHDEHVRRMAELRRELQSLPRERTAALRSAARSGKPGDAAKLDERERVLTAELESETRAMRAANDAGRAAERELVVLHADRFGEFAEAAEQLTAEAADKLAALETGYRDAHEAIETARREWALIATDRNKTLAARLSPGERAQGAHRRQQLSPPPANPLPPRTEVFDSPAIRPPEIEPLTEAA